MHLFNNLISFYFSKKFINDLPSKQVMEGKTCSSCKKKVANDKGSVNFNCPSCNDYEIVRCKNCRSNASQYTCPNCNFVGPN